MQIGHLTGTDELAAYEARTRRGITPAFKLVDTCAGEFDYCCCHASYAVRELGYEAIIVNSNPETVSTDYDTSDKLYFEPLTREDVLAIVEEEQPEGVIVQLGDGGAIGLAHVHHEAGRSSDAQWHVAVASRDGAYPSLDTDQFHHLLGQCAGVALGALGGREQGSYDGPEQDQALGGHEQAAGPSFNH